MLTYAGKTVSDETIPDLVTSLEEIGSGTCRIVFDLGDVVLKVNRGDKRALHGSCETEAAHWEAFAGTENEHLFAPVLASGNGWLIMAKADDISTGSESDYWDVMHEANALGISDLFHANIGIFDGQCRVIDYATGCVGQGYVSESFCECGDHGCRECYADGCECCCSLHRGEDEPCSQFTGCNAETCETERCYEPATYHWQESFGFARGTHWVGANGVGMVDSSGYFHACDKHNPHNAPVRTQVFGQRGLAVSVGGSAFLLPWERRN